MMQQIERAVLIVDDDEAVRHILVELVASRGYPVTEASDGDEAWAQLLNEPHHVVVSDLQMPHCDGRELCRRIREEPSLRDIRIVIVSGCTDLPNPDELQCDSVLRKPISVPMLIREIQQAPTSPASPDVARARST